MRTAGSLGFRWPGVKQNGSRPVAMRDDALPFAPPTSGKWRCGQLANQKKNGNRAQTP